jgi:hypothetical protein
MAKVRSGAADRYVKRASVATEDYAAGVRDPRQDWQAATIAAAPVQAAAIQQAIQRGSFAKGVQKAGTARWREKALSKGTQRFASGVADAVSDYAKGVAPFLQAIEQTQLPPRGPKGDPKNIQRVAVLAAALHKKKLEQA